jgi:hypothetical protein
VALSIILAAVLYVTTLVAGSGSAHMAKRWGAESSQSDAMLRFDNAIYLINLYATSPGHWIQGLGFYSFGATNPYGEPYTHVISVDMLCEQGLVGAVLFIAIIVATVRSLRVLYKLVGSEPQARWAIGNLAALIIYQFVLVNKQGNLAGSFAFFLLMIIPCRLAKRAELGISVVFEYKDEPIDQSGLQHSPV